MEVAVKVGFTGTRNGMIATPFDTTRRLLGGTWYTVMQAEKVNKKVYIVWPDGHLTTIDPEDA